VLVSGQPHPEGVTEIIAILRNADVLESEQNDLRPKIEAMSARLKEVTEQLVSERRRLRPLLESMDLSSLGNFGWESRFGWFLAEMRRQVIRIQKQGGR
jgi:hypothetical protein